MLEVTYKFNFSIHAVHVARVSNTAVTEREGLRWVRACTISACTGNPRKICACAGVWFVKLTDAGWASADPGGILIAFIFIAFIFKTSEAQVLAYGSCSITSSTVGVFST